VDEICLRLDPVETARDIVASDAVRQVFLGERFKLAR
jgi:hypothetical protein